MVSLLSRTATGTYIKIDIKILCIWTLVSQPSWMSCISPISQKEMKVPTTVSLSILAWISPILIYVVYFSWPFWIWDIIEFDSIWLTDRLYRQSYHFSHCMINVSLFKVFFYLHKKASLLDTKNSRPGYCMINMESPPDILEYNFISQSLVDQYWVDLRHISINSHLGCKSKWRIYKYQRSPGL